MRRAEFDERVRASSAYLGERGKQILKDIWDPQHFQAIGLWLAAFSAGFVAVEYARAFRFVEQTFHSINSLYPGLILALTPIALMASGWLVQKFAPGAAGSGIPQILAAHETDDSKIDGLAGRLLSLRVAAIKILSSLLAVLAGGAVGREGPTLHVATCVFYAFGSRVRKYFPNVSPQTWIVAGAAAGLASAFNTPLGGIVYAIEEFSNAHFHRVKMQLITSVIVAGLVSQWLLGPYLYLGLPRLNPVAWSILPYTLLIGVLGGGLGGLFGVTLGKAMSWRRSLNTRWTWVVAGVSGFMVASILIYLPEMAGSGYGLMTETLFKAKHWDVLSLGARFMATILTYLSGAAGGIFAPSLSMGAMLGEIAGSYFSTSSTNLLVLLGMISVLTGVTRTPFTAFILVLEMTDRHAALFPMMIAALVAQQTAWMLKRRGFYDETKDVFLKWNK